MNPENNTEIPNPTEPSPVANAKPSSGKSKPKKGKSPAKVKTPPAPRGVGRPQKKVVWPQGKFTVNMACEANPHLCRLTIINHLTRDTNGNESPVVKLTDLAKSTHEKGLGRRAFLFIRRSKLTKSASIASNVSIPIATEATEATEVSAHAVSVEA